MRLRARSLRFPTQRSPTMKRFLIATSLVTTVLLAGTALANDKDKFRMMDTDGDGRISASEHAAGSQQMFMMMDANKDGAVTMEEMKAKMEMMKRDKDHGHDTMGRDRMRSDDRGGY
jgi:Ca2+-binding EF-hand superfamily protein